MISIPCSFHVIYLQYFNITKMWYHKVHSMLSTFNISISQRCDITEFWHYKGRRWPKRFSRVCMTMLPSFHLQIPCKFHAIVCTDLNNRWEVLDEKWYKQVRRNRLRRLEYENIGWDIIHGIMEDPLPLRSTTVVHIPKPAEALRQGYCPKGLFFWLHFSIGTLLDYWEMFKI